MQLHKFYGRTLKGTLTRVRRELGEDALILETRTLAPGSAGERMNPGARYEVCAVREHPAPEPAASAIPSPSAPSASPIPRPLQGQTLLHDLGLLRAEIRELLDDQAPEERLGLAHLDLEDYRGLIALGIAPEVLAPHFRAWLQWRTATPMQRRWLARTEPIAGAMGSESLREWLWHAWSARLDPDGQSEGEGSVVGLIGLTGVGKTTTLAKMSSKLRQKNRQNNVIVTLDTQRFGATEQVRRLAKLLGVTLHEVVSQEDLVRSMNQWDRFDWVGIDTPGGMTPDSPAGQLYGRVLAQMGDVRTLLLMPASTQEADGREQMRRAQAFGARRVLFSKVDETTRPGGMVNLTMDGHWKIDSLTTGQRVPEDWRAADRALLWEQVLAPRAEAGVA